jgi:UDP-N-acetylmuramyl pentapeptide phosphotransferase/UDP-N-acetylglucosamine-1-phosphate transferase
MPWAPPVAVIAASDRWLLGFSIAALLVVAGALIARRGAQAARDRAHGGGPARRGMRRRSGALVALGPAVGLVVARDFEVVMLVAVLGALALAVFGLATERQSAPQRATVVAASIAAAAAVAAGARFGPTGVVGIDVIATWAFIVVVTEAADGLGNSDGLACGVGLGAASGLFALAAFGSENTVACVAVGLGGACFGFLAFNTRPASLFIGRGGRLAIGYTLAVGALAARPAAGPAGPAGEFAVPVILLGMLGLDAGMVVVGRLRRGRALTTARSDHLVHRLAASGWSRAEASALLVVAQVALSIVALLAGRRVLPVWFAVAVAALILVALTVAASRERVDQRSPIRLPHGVRLGLLFVCLAIAAAVLPVVFVARDAADLMDRGRVASTRALTAARDGDAILASGSFRRAALTFARAGDKLDSPLLAGGLAVPGLAPNMRAARELADIGTDLARAGEDVTTAVKPEALEIIGGRVPLEEVRRITPKLEAGSDALSRALARLRVLDDPYLIAPIRDAVDKVERELSHADGEARRGVAAAEVGPALLGGDGTRHYLLVVQNNAESRATGGFIGNFGLMTAQDGKVSIGELERTATWNEALARAGRPPGDAPADYHARYDQFGPARTLQNVNLSPDFPSVAQLLMSLTPAAGLGPVDGVFAVDPFGLAALLQLTGPVNVEGWPTPIDASNAVDVTLNEAYAFFERTPERAEFLGDVAQAVVDEATSGSLGKPAQVARVLGGAAHEGHLILAFARPEEQKFAEDLGVSGRVAPVRSDAVAVTTSNSGANKIDFYLHRNVNYRVQLDPDVAHRRAVASGRLTVQLDNTAPDQGLPQIVIGPYRPELFQAGENRAYLSLYSPLALQGASLDGGPVAISSGVERGRNVYSLLASVPARATRMLTADLGGAVRLRPGGWYELDVGHQPTVEPDRLRVSIEVPEGWRIAEAPGLTRESARRVTSTTTQEEQRRVRVRVVPDSSPWDLWDRLQDG